MQFAKGLHSGHKVASKPVLIAALAAGLLGTSVASAGAATTPYRIGTGSFQAVSHLNPPPQTCATYSNYHAQLSYSDGPNPPTTVTLSSDPNPLSLNYQWGEFSDGTHHPQTSATGSTSCTDSPGQPEAGFTGTLTNSAGTCTLGSGTYQRGGALAGKFPALDIQFVFNTVAGTCGITAPVTFNTTIVHTTDPTDPTGYISACDSPIAPQSCVLGNADF